MIGISECKIEEQINFDQYVQRELNITTEDHERIVHEMDIVDLLRVTMYAQKKMFDEALNIFRKYLR